MVAVGRRILPKAELLDEADQALGKRDAGATFEGDLGADDRRQAGGMVVALWDRARLAEGDERAEWWERAVAAFPNYADYQEKTEREIPVFLLEPTAE